MKRYPFKSKLLGNIVIPYSIISIILISGFASTIYHMVENQRYHSEKRYQEELNSKILNIFDSFIDEMDNVALRVHSDSNIVLFYTHLSQDKNPENFFEKNVLQSIELASVVNTINSPYHPLWRISMYNHYGDFLSVGAKTDPGVVRGTLAELNVSEMMVNLQYDQFHVEYRQRDIWSDYFKSQYVVIQRPIINEYSKKIYAVVEVEQDIKTLLSRISFDTPDIKYSIYDSKGNYVYGTAKEELDKNWYKTSLTSERYGWTVNLYRNNKVGLNSILIVFIAMYIVLIAANFALIYRIAYSITKPLRELEQSVRKVSGRNLTVETDDSTIDEIKELGNAFSEVLMQVEKSAKEEQKALVLALQSQMNPHFLFNTLSVISSKSLEIGGEEIALMCQKICDMLRYVASYDDLVVSVSSEISHVKNYLDLMKARYEDYFSYEIQADSAVHHVKVPKLILQPLAENCFNHAFKDVEPPWHIKITSGLDGNYFFFTVEDNGSGMDEKQLEQIKQKIDYFSENFKEKYKELSIGGLGLVSAVLRMKMANYNVDYAVETSKKGTKITIRGEMV